MKVCMPHNEILQISCAACSVSMRETFIVPTLLPICCVCGLIRDDTRCSPSREPWIMQRTYHETYGVHPLELVLTHTYCPICYTKAHDSVQEDSWEVETVA
jgi:hypothetical protein